ncbi:signal transduction histidine kinase [Ectothiorhodospira mobilis]|uniref:histidine kinase n=1 Tax=Ectothiorhodospira mobilis TaxID=195064 RepID=A0A1I4PCD4_ECTMO|nr:XrtA/PEP-CTERM system histidine kinase PrsK [Ectothiorhodospira mobilis]SFM25176.1 signal transduction histidine kinase [Ectothiorhodospira mobilis]
MDVGVTGFGVAAAANLLLVAVLAIGWKRRLQGALLILAAFAGLTWAVVLGLRAGYPQAVGIPVIFLAELLRDAAWIAFLWGLIRQARSPAGAEVPSRPGPPRGGPNETEGSGAVSALPGGAAGLSPPLRALGLGALGLVALLACYAFLLPWLPAVGFRGDVLLAGKLLVALAVLLLVEQIFRNSTTEARWAIQYLCLALLGIYGFDFYLYAEGLLFHQVSGGLWAARGFVSALVVPLIAVSAARNPQWSLDVYVSRGMVFHTATLLGAGGYLLLMAAAGYYLRTFGGEWGTVLQAVFLFAALLGVLVFWASGHLRSRFRVFVSKHFFNYKYDYREEWLRLIHTLSDSRSREGLPDRVVRALADIVESPGGQLWMRDGGRHFRQVAQWNMVQPTAAGEARDGALGTYLGQTGWVLDLHEVRTHPEAYPDLELPGWLAEDARAWLLVPLRQEDDLLGFVLLAPSRALKAINWEDRDLLKTAGKQAASHLAQMEALQALSEARQFEAFNRLSAYVVHDLKNIIAQLSLVVSNARKHGDNPAFLKDAIGTVENAVERMNRLMLQLRSGDPGREATPVDLAGLAQQAVAAAQGRAPRPQLAHNGDECPVLADPERLRAVLGHLLQNAQEATPGDGRVDLSLWRDSRNAHLEITDTGTGMTPEFIRERLFRPFDTTKGLTGMGIGAFESREFIRALGGDLEVWSEPGQGSRFRISIPLARDQEAFRSPGMRD